MSQKTHSQDLNSDPRNQDDYDTWEYGTEPIPEDPTWVETKEPYSSSWTDMSGDWNDFAIGLYSIGEGKNKKTES